MTDTPATDPTGSDPTGSDPSPSRPPRFNHVAMSVDRDLLSPQGRAELLDFYGEVFGWTEAPGMSRDGEQLVFLCHRHDQFVFLLGTDDPMRAPRMDHFGQSVQTRGELDALHRRAAGGAGTNDRVDVIDPVVDEFPGLALHAFYVGFLLPLMVETQYWEWT